MSGLGARVDVAVVPMGGLTRLRDQRFELKFFELIFLQLITLIM